MKVYMLITLFISQGVALKLNVHDPELPNLAKSEENAESGYMLGVSGELSREEYDEMHRQFKPKTSNSHLKTKSPKTLMFIHVHKSLGTWMCNAMQSAGATTPMNSDGSPSPDCEERDDMPWHVNDFEWFETANTCANRKKNLDEKGYTFFEIERQIHFEGGDVCPDFSTAIIFRDPIARMQSQMQVRELTYENVTQLLKRTDDLEHAHSWMRSHVGYDNFYIRTLLGRDFFLGSGKITRDHLEKAKQNLLKVDAVLDANDLLTQVTQLEAITGKDLQKHAATQRHQNYCQRPENTLKDGSVCADFFLTEDNRKELLKVNALDMEFYEFAKELAKSLTEKVSK